MTIDKLRDAYVALDEFGCTDHGCVLRQHGNRGMGTNGGCRCLHHHNIGDNEKKSRAIARLVAAVRESLKEGTR